MMKTIAIIAGGDSSECEVSLKSANGIFSFIENADYQKFIVTIIGKNWNVILPDGTQIPIDKNDFSFVLDSEKIIFDFAYITIHGTPGENGILQGYFELLQIPYSGCGVLASSLTFDKYFCNNFLKNFDINVAEAVLVKANNNTCHCGLDPQSCYIQAIPAFAGMTDENFINNHNIIEKLGLPVFVKPTDGGSSFGITKVKTAEQLQSAIDKAFDEGGNAMIESFIEGKEFTCGMYKTREKVVILPVFEIESDNEFFDYEAKYNGKSREFPAKSISAEKQKEIQQLTEKIYDLLNAKGIIRVDYIVEKSGKIVLLEVNTTPGMTAQSFIPQQVRAAGLNISDVMTEIIENELLN